MQIRVVPDEACPECGRVGSPKVGHEDGTWAWRCPSTYDECKVGYYTPETGEVEYKLPPDEHQAMVERIRREVQESMQGKVWITRGNTSRMIPADEPVPEGWHLGAE